MLHAVEAVSLEQRVQAVWRGRLAASCAARQQVIEEVLHHAGEIFGTVRQAAVKRSSSARRPAESRRASVRSSGGTASV